ncbi:MAG: hypothetical protein R3E79_27905 [Caldilineaceae bacterium]
MPTITKMKAVNRTIYPLMLLTMLVAACVLIQPAASPTTAYTTAATANDSAFPVTVEHKYGSTTITETPQRIVTVGLTDHDAPLALGIVPVGTSEWFGGYPGLIWPWAQDELEALGGEVPAAVGGDAINFEAIAGCNRI